MSASVQQRPLPYEEIARAALKYARIWLPEWLPGGKFVGDEYVCADIHGGQGRSFSVNWRTGAWGEFGSGPDEKGGDLISLRAAILRCQQHDAALELGELTGVLQPRMNGRVYTPAPRPAPIPSPPVEREDPWVPIVPAPSDAVPAPQKKLRGFDMVFEYFDEAGRLLFYVGRREARGDRRKLFTPITYGTFEGELGWHFKAPTPRPLYGLHRLAAMPEAAALVFEGEKKTDLAQKLFPGFACLSICGGAKAVKNNDVRPLLNRSPVIYFPDNNKVGHDAGNEFCKLVPHARLVRVDDLPEDHDIADITFGADENPEEWLRDRIIPPKQAEEPAPEPEGRDAVTALVEELNQTFMVVNESGKAMVYRERTNPTFGHLDYERITFPDFERLLSNRFVTVQHGNETKRRNAAKLWLAHPDRRQYLGGVTLDPSKKTLPDVLNLWRGFAVEPKKGKWSTLRTHLLSTLCQGDEALFDYLMGWMATLAQHPEKQGEVAVVLRGPEGCGKGTLGRALAHIFGAHGIQITHSRHLVGNFNAHFRGVVFVFADEAFYAGDKANVGVLKSIITEPYLAIEGKHQAATIEPNRLHLLMASNEDWVIPASLAARRFFMLNAGHECIGQREYFRELYAELESGGYEALLYDLLSHDLTGFDVRNVPDTAALQDQKKRSLPSAEAWWHDCLHRGYVFESKFSIDFFAEWHPWLATDLLYASFEAFAKSRRDRHPLCREHFGQFMKRYCGGQDSTRQRAAVVGEYMGEETTPYGSTVRKPLTVTKRASGYLIGPLDEARATFCRITGLTVRWPEEAED